MPRIPLKVGQSSKNNTHLGVVDFQLAVAWTPRAPGNAATTATEKQHQHALLSEWQQQIQCCVLCASLCNDHGNKESCIPVAQSPAEDAGLQIAIPDSIQLDSSQMMSNVLGKARQVFNTSDASAFHMDHYVSICICGACIYDVLDAIHGQRGLCNVGGLAVHFIGSQRMVSPANQYATYEIHMMLYLQWACIRKLSLHQDMFLLLPFEESIHPQCETRVISSWLSDTCKNACLAGGHNDLSLIAALKDLGLSYGDTSLNSLGKIWNMLKLKEASKLFSNPQSLTDFKSKAREWKNH